MQPERLDDGADEQGLGAVVAQLQSRVPGLLK